MNSVHGHFFFLNMSAVKDIGYFDEKIFFYYEESDYCIRANKKNHKVYLMKNLRVNHIGGNSYNENKQRNIDPLRHWHLMWGKFYFNKKHYGLLKAYLVTLPDFIESIIKLSIFYFIDKKKFLIFKNRLSGLVNSALGKRSWKRPN